MQVKKTELKKAVAFLSKVVKNNAALPVIQCVELTAGNGQLTLRGTNLDTEVVYMIPADTPIKGRTFVNIAQLRSLVGAATRPTIDVEIYDNIGAAIDGIKLDHVNVADDFPAEVVCEDTVLLTGDNIVESLKAAAPFVAPDEGGKWSRNLRTYFFCPNGIVATDGKALIHITHDFHDLKDHVIFRHSEVFSSLPPSGCVALHQGNSGDKPYWVLRGMNWGVASRITPSARYPEWERITPAQKGCVRSVTLPASETIAKIKALKSLSNLGDMNRDHITMSASDHLIVLKGANGQSAAVEADIQGDWKDFSIIVAADIAIKTLNVASTWYFRGPLDTILAVNGGVEVVAMPCHPRN